MPSFDECPPLAVMDTVPAPVLIVELSVSFWAVMLNALPLTPFSVIAPVAYSLIPASVKLFNA